MRKPKNVFRCFVAIYSALFCMVGFVAHMEASRREMVRCMTEMDQRLEELEERPTAIVTVGDDGSLRLETKHGDNHRSDRDRSEDGDVDDHE